MTGADGRPVLKLKVRAPPAEGEANEAVVRLVAKALGAPRSAIRIAAGASARVKHLEIEGVSAAELDRAFGAPPAA